ncbi:MAG: molybdenum cofactor guanylyltransferase [Acidimicrobiales bacterium]
MASAGLLLTGGASRRMGVDKAALVLPGGRETLAERTGRLLESAAAPALEVGPGRSRLDAIADEPPGQGPLAATACGVRELRRLGWSGPVMVVATDLPGLTAVFLRWLADHPSDRSVVPLAGGRPQPLCARYRAEDLATAEDLVAGAKRAMSDLLARIDPLLVDPGEWCSVEGIHPPAGVDGLLADADTPADLAMWTGPGDPRRSARR